MTDARCRADDALRTGRLLLAREAMAGVVDEQRLRAVEPQARPADGLAARTAARVRLRAGRTDHLTAVRGLVDARRAALGPGAADLAPRLLVRVDEFPFAGSYLSAEVMTRGFRQFDKVMADAGVPYLLAVTPQIAREFLRPHDDGVRDLVSAERHLLAALPPDRVTFGLHGLDHRTRVADPRRRSEFAGLDDDAVRRRLDAAADILRPLGIEPSVLVPPYNHVDGRQLPVLAERFEVICGGPETVRALGLQAGPAWRDGTVVLPSYPPAYGTAAEIHAGLPGLLDGAPGLWVPLVIHWEWELANGFVDLRGLLRDIRAYVEPWDTFLREVRWSRDA